jgi:hypothetical protein
MVLDEALKVWADGDGSTTDVTYPYKYYSDSDLLCYIVTYDESASGTASLKTLNVDYTIAASAIQGCVVTFTTPATELVDNGDGTYTGQKYFITRLLTYKQTVSIPAVGTFNEATIQNMIDRAVLLIQQLRDAVDRTVTLSLTTDVTSLDFTGLEDGKMLKMQDNGDGTWSVVPSTYDADEGFTDAIAEVDAQIAAAQAILDQLVAGDYIESTETDASGYSFVKDEDDMASNSATHLPTQQSAKAYIDAAIAALSALCAKLAGDQTVAGVKTFSSSPIVPTPTTDYQASTKKYVDDTALPGDASAGNYCIVGFPGTVDGGGGGYNKAIEIKLDRGGEFRINFEMASGVGGSLYVRVYRNGSPVGTEYLTNTGSWVSKTEDISGWTSGDLLQIYTKEVSVNQQGVRFIEVCVAAPEFTPGIYILGTKS